MNRLRSKLTYANVVATLALFVALAGGTAYAANQMLPKNSVGGKQIKKEAVTAAKIKNGTVTGSKIALSTLGTVPTAGHANTADTATHASSANTADTATHASSADSAGMATLATSATIADEAKALGGLTAAQIEAAGELTCPTGTFMVANTCVEEAQRMETTWLLATETCEKAGRLLPSPAQLAAYDLAKNNGQTEWTDSIFYYPPESEWDAVRMAETPPAALSIGAAGIDDGNTESYRCVVPPGN